MGLDCEGLEWVGANKRIGSDPRRTQRLCERRVAPSRISAVALPVPRERGSGAEA